MSDSTHGHVSAWYTCHTEEKSSEFLLSSVKTGGILTHVGSDNWVIANLFWSKKMRHSNNVDQKTFSIKFTEERFSLYVFVTLWVPWQCTQSFFLPVWLTLFSGPHPHPPLRVNENGAIARSARVITLASNLLYAWCWARLRGLYHG